MKKKTLLITAGLALFTLTTALVATANAVSSGFLVKANPSEYTLTLDKTTKFSGSSGVGTAYTANENPIGIHYTNAKWDSSAKDYFVTFNNPAAGTIYNETALSGITQIDVRAKKQSSGPGVKLDIILSVGRFLSYSDEQTTYERSSIDLSTSFETYTLIPETNCCNYFTLNGIRAILIDSSIDIEFIKVTYSCSMSKAVVRTKGNAAYGSGVISNKDDKKFAEFAIGETAIVTAVPNDEIYEFTGWHYKDDPAAFSIDNPMNYLVTNKTGFHDLYPRFAERDCITVSSNNDDYGSAKFSDGTKKKMAYVDTEYTVVATPAESNLENGFFPVFEGWYLNGTKVSSNSTYTFTVPVSGAAYEMEAKFATYSETFNQGVRLCYQDYDYFDNLRWYEEETDTFVKSYDGAYYDLESYVGTISGKGHCETQSYDADDLWHQHARGTSALTPYLRLNKNYSKYYKADGKGNQEKVTVKDFDPDKIASIEFIFDKSGNNSRDDISISGGASSFALTQKGITDPIDGQKISKFYLTDFSKDEMIVRIPDDLSDVNYFKLKRLVVHYKIVIPALDNSNN